MGKWKVVKIRDIAFTKSGGTPKRGYKAYWENGSIPWLKSGELEDNKNITENSEYITDKAVENSSAKPFPEGTLLLAMYGATAGKLGILGKEAATNQVICSIQNRKGLFLPEFIFNYLLLIRNDIIRDSFGGAQPNISKSYIDNIKIPLPPLPEQQRIVAKLDALFAKIDRAIALLEENIAHTQALMGSVLDEEFGRLEKFEPFLDSIFIQNKTLIPDDDEIYNYVGLENIESHTGKLVNFLKSRGKDIKSSKVYFKNNDVLYGKLRPYLNKVWVSDFDGIATTEILPFTPKEKKLLPKYLAYYLRSNKFLNIVNANTSGARMPRASARFFKDIAQVPKVELNLQEKIITKFDKLFTYFESMIKLETQKLHHLKSLKSSFLDQAFRGEL